MISTQQVVVTQAPAQAVTLPQNAGKVTIINQDLANRIRYGGSAVTDSGTTPPTSTDGAPVYPQTAREVDGHDNLFLVAQTGLSVPVCLVFEIN